MLGCPPALISLTLHQHLLSAQCIALHLTPLAPHVYLWAVFTSDIRGSATGTRTCPPLTSARKIYASFDPACNRLALATHSRPTLIAVASGAFLFSRTFLFSSAWCPASDWTRALPSSRRSTTVRVIPNIAQACCWSAWWMRSGLGRRAAKASMTTRSSSPLRGTRGHYEHMRPQCNESAPPGRIFVGVWAGNECLFSALSAVVPWGSGQNPGRLIATDTVPNQ